jgi:vanillate O-demethylase ferredoxin subunit
MAGLISVKLGRVSQEAKGIKSFSLVSADGEELPGFTPGAHIDVHLSEEIVRQYSIYNSPAETDCYRIAVQREDQGRGGSKAMHDLVKPGEILEISTPRNHFPLSDDANHYILLAGGIGITPILAMARQLAASNASFEMHYCTRNPELAAFKDILGGAGLKEHVVFHFDDGPAEQLLDLNALLATHSDGTEVYMCGPTGFMNAVKKASEHWPAEAINMEFFAKDPSHDTSKNTSFKIELAKTQKTLDVPADKSILEVLAEHGIFMPSVCKQGVCGTCVAKLIDGEPDHRDTVLKEKQRNKMILTCCSRSKSDTLVLNL